MMVNSIFKFQKILVAQVQKTLNSSSIKPGFQYLPELLKYEEKETFATGEAIGAFARLHREQLIKNAGLSAERAKVKHIIRLLRDAISESELESRCLDISHILALILEKESIWSVVYNGSIIYDDFSNSVHRHMYYVDDLLLPLQDSRAQGHSWVFTPAYPVIDLTAKFQALPESIKEHVPDPVLIQTDGPFEDSLSHYLDISESSDQQGQKRAILDQKHKYPEWNRLHLPALYQGEIEIKYIPMGITFPDKPLEEFATGITFEGINPMDLYNKLKKDF